MISIEYDGYCGPRMPQEVQLRRVQNVIDHELTEKQRRAFVGYFIEHKNVVQLAKEYGLNKSTISRTLHRALRRMRAYLKY